MDDVRRSLRRSRSRPGVDVAYDEDFLYHLSRGSELLVENRVVEAKEELERALAHRPEDARSHDLLAGVYFRLGVYPRAISIWTRLLSVFPDDVTLRVNLGLALLKTGQPEDALGHLRHALALEPDHARAWGYLGLVLWRLGRVEDARDAFVRGGQASMARRMEEYLGSSAGGLSAPPPPPAPVDDRDAAEVRTTAASALDRLDHASPLTLAEGAVRRTGSGQWRVVEAGADAIPRAAIVASSLPADAPMSLGQLLGWWGAAIPDGQPLVVSPAGLLLVCASGGVHARRGGLRALRGTPASAPLPRRFRRHDDAEPVGGGDDAVLRWEGPLHAMFAPSGGDRFQAVRLEDEVLYVVERFVQAFDDQVSFESGRLPAAAGAEPLVQFRGRGTVILRVPRAPSAIEVAPGEEARVALGALLGWTGRLFPIDEPVADDATHDVGEGADVPLLMRGDGTLILV